MNLLYVEEALMTHCLKVKGKWWANHFFRNKEVDELYYKLRKKNLGTVISFLERI